MSELSKLPRRDMGDLVMAVIDGEADADDRALVLAAVAADPKLAEEIPVFVRTGRSLGALFNGVMAQPMPGQLLFTVRNAGQELPAGDSPMVRRSGGWNDWLRNWQIPGAALAGAAVALAAGWLVIEDQPDAAGGPLRLSSEVAQQLTIDTSQSEHTVVSGAGTFLFRVVQSVRDKDGVPCREYETQGATGPRQYGLACRDGGTWRLRALLLGGPQNNKLPSTASVDLGTNLDEVADQFKVGEALGSDAVAKLIADGWPASK